MNDLEIKLTELAKRYMAMGLGREDLDEICMIAAHGKNELPQRLLDVIFEYDKKYNAYAVDPQIDFLKRVLRIIEVSKTLQSTDQNETLLPTFSLKHQDVKRIEVLCMKMREIIFETDFFDDAHRRRLLDRLTLIEREIHQPKGKFDIVRGGLNDLGETLGKFGKDIKPLTDRMNEIVDIARKATGFYDQLPAPKEIKKLPKPGSANDDTEVA